MSHCVNGQFYFIGRIQIFKFEGFGVCGERATCVYFYCNKGRHKRWTNCNSGSQWIYMDEYLWYQHPQQVEQDQHHRNALIPLPVIIPTKDNSYSDFQHHKLVLPTSNRISRIINIRFLVLCFFLYYFHEIHSYCFMEESSSFILIAA